MEIKNLKWLGILVVAIVFSSCGMQKRLYTKGFYAHKTKTVKTPDPDIVTENLTLKTENPKSKTPDSKLLASNSQNIEASVLDFKPTDACDTIVLKSGAKITTTIKDATTSDIKYRTCPVNNGLILTIKKSDVKGIHYGNGRNEVFEEEHPYNQPANLPEDKFTQYNNSSYHQNRNVSDGKKTNGFSIVGLITAFIPFQVGIIFAFLNLTETITLNGGGIAAISPAWFVIPLLFAFLSFVLCLTALIQIKKNKETQRGSGMAVLGLILSLIVMIALLGLLISA